MKPTRRQFVAASAALSVPILLGARFAHANTEIVVGGVYDISGPLQQFGEAKANMLRFAVEETNAAGGLLGRPVKLVIYDTQSNVPLYSQYGQRLALNDKAAVVHGGVLSAAREVMRPIMRRANVPYFYNMRYEGGVCDRNTVITGTTPTQSLQLMIPWAIKEFGPKIYVLGPDYNFGQITEKWIEKLAKENGGQVVGKELFPLDAANFSATISNIQRAQPDFIFNSFVGPAHASFYTQWAAAGMKGKMPMLSQTFGDGGEQLAMPIDATEGIYIMAHYLEELDTPENQAFLKRYHARFGDKGYISNLFIGEYVGWKIYAAAVEKAGSTDPAAVAKALAEGIAVDTPAGTIRLDPTTQHIIADMHLARFGKDGKFEILESWKDRMPVDTEGQCDLVANPRTNRQFEPSI